MFWNKNIKKKLNERQSEIVDAAIRACYLNLKLKMYKYGLDKTRKDFGQEFVVSIYRAYMYGVVRFVLEELVLTHDLGERAPEWLVAALRLADDRLTNQQILEVIDDLKTTQSDVVLGAIEAGKITCSECIGYCEKSSLILDWATNYVGVIDQIMKKSSREQQA